MCRNKTCNKLKVMIDTIDYIHNIQ